MGKVHAGELRVSRETLAGYWERYLAARKPYLEEGSWIDYRTHGEKRILPHLGHRKLTALTALTAPEVRDWLVGLHETGQWAPKTLNNTLKVLVVCLNCAVADGLIPANPAAHVQTLPAGHIERDYLRLHEIGAYLDACHPVYRPLAETLAGTGMRISEALALTLADLDLLRGAIIVARSFKTGGKIGSTKGDRFRRVEIGPQLAELANRLRRAPRRRGPRAGRQNAAFVALLRRRPGDRGRWASEGRALPLDRSTVSREWHRVTLLDAGLRHMPLHSLRHTAAAAWLSTGQPLMYVQRQLGHAQITTTERLYGHLEETFVRRAAAETDAAIRAAAAKYAADVDRASARYTPADRTIHTATPS
jgi:integrase